MPFDINVNHSHARLFNLDTDATESHR